MEIKEKHWQWITNMRIGESDRMQKWQTLQLTIEAQMREIKQPNLEEKNK